MEDVIHDGPVLARPALGSLAHPTWLAFRILHVGFAALPLIAGADKFFHALTNWSMYLAPVFTSSTGLRPDTFMMIVGVIEIGAGMLVAFAPRIGAWVVAAWLWGIIANLVALGGYYDVALRDFGLSLGAISLALMARDR